LEELKDHLNFRLTTTNESLKIQANKDYDVLLFFEDYFIGNSYKELLKDIQKIKILAYCSNKISKDYFTDSISLPFSVENLNGIIKNSMIKKSFSQNSSIKIKEYFLDKNEKKLIKEDAYVLLTEKEIQLLELFLKSKEILSKNRILEKVWRYSSEADTHTVETHIYRLRKKIKSKFQDDDFIINNKSGYQL